MKQLKYTTSVVLVFLAMIIIGELYAWHISSFYTTFPSTTLYLQEGQNAADLVFDVQKAAENEGIEVFAVDIKVNNAFSVSLDIYGTDGVAAYLGKHFQIYNGSFSSIILGDFHVSIHPLNDAVGSYTPEYFFLIGKYERNVAFKQELIDKYAGNFPQDETPSDMNGRMIAGVWVAVIFLLLLISAYDVTQSRKEAVVRMVSGEPLTYFVGKRILWDCLIFSGIFLSLFLLLRKITPIYYHWSISALSFLCFLCLNSLLQVRLLRIDFRKVDSREEAKRILKVSYVYKCAVVAVCVFTVSGSLSLLQESWDCYRQREFYEERKDYSFVNLSALSGSPADIDKLGASLLEPFYPDRMFTLVNLQAGNKGVEYVYADGSAEIYLKSQISEINNFLLERKIYFLIPEAYSDDPQILDDAQNIWQTYYHGNYDYEVIPCRSTATIAISGASQISSSILDLPVIIFNCLGLESYSDFYNFSYILENTMLNLDDEAKTVLAQRVTVNYYTNVYENYLKSLKSAKRNALVGITFLVIISLLNIVISKSMLLCNYRVNAAENCIKKILGYGILEANISSLLPTFAVGLVSVIASAVAVSATAAGSVVFCVVAGTIYLLLDMIIVMYNIRATSHLAINQIIRGGPFD